MISHRLPGTRIMEQTIFARQERPLLKYAISKLNPGVFSHPVWIRFGILKGSISPESMQGLYVQAEQLLQKSPAEACQILMICAVYQSAAGRLDTALRNVQQALAIAERNSLARETLWATWGACALCIQGENHEQAIRYLEYLQSTLNRQNEWILADFIEIIIQSIRCPAEINNDQLFPLSPGQNQEDLAIRSMDLLYNWGYTNLIADDHKQHGRRHFQKHTRLNKNSAPSLLQSQKSQTSWGFLVGSFRSFLSNHIVDFRSKADLPDPPNTTIPSSRKEEHDNHNLSSIFASMSIANGAAEQARSIQVVVQMLGCFSITIKDLPVRVPASRGLSLFKYLLYQHKQDIPREVLMDIFWPDADAESARNNLNVAIHSLRQALRSITNDVVIRFEDGAYGLSPNLDVWLDVEEFNKYIKEGQQLEVRKQTTEAVASYEIAANLYQGDFLADSPYEDWTCFERDQLRISYLDILDHISSIYFNQERYAACIAQCQLLLARDVCREDVHFRLMQCYSRLGQSPLALRQYQICTESLRKELDIDPALETTQLYGRIKRREPV
jgi:DNA-binding SARP family transcriptional activator